MHFAVEGGTVTAVPKCGSSSIRMALFGKLYDVRERDVPEGYWVAFVRHPLARLVSCYQHWIVDTFHHRMAIHGLRRHMPFAEFVQAVAAIPDSVADMHFKSLSETINGEPEFIGRVETIAEDWRHVQKKFNVRAIGRHNSTNHPDWKSFYTPELTALAVERYREDMERFYASDL